MWKLDREENYLSKYEIQIWQFFRWWFLWILVKIWLKTIFWELNKNALTTQYKGNNCFYVFESVLCVWVVY